MARSIAHHVFLSFFIQNCNDYCIAFDFGISELRYRFIVGKASVVPPMDESKQRRIAEREARRYIKILHPLNI